MIAHDTVGGESVAGTIFTAGAKRIRLATRLTRHANGLIDVGNFALFVAQHARQDTEASTAGGARFAVVLFAAVDSIGTAAAGRALVRWCARRFLQVHNSGSVANETLDSKRAVR